MKRIVGGDYYQNLAEILKLPKIPDVFRLPYILSDESLIGHIPEAVSDRSIKDLQDGEVSILCSCQSIIRVPVYYFLIQNLRGCIISC